MKDYEKIESVYSINKELEVSYYYKNKQAIIRLENCFLDKRFKNFQDFFKVDDYFIKINNTNFNEVKSIIFHYFKKEVNFKHERTTYKINNLYFNRGFKYNSKSLNYDIPIWYFKFTSEDSLKYITNNDLGKEAQILVLVFQEFNTLEEAYNKTIKILEEIKNS